MYIELLTIIFEINLIIIWKLEFLQYLIPNMCRNAKYHSQSSVNILYIRISFV